MNKKILIFSGSPKKDGNTAALTGWFAEGARSKGAEVEIVSVASLGMKVNGCLSCRRCQERREYECVVKDEVTPAVAKMARADVIVMATPLYFFTMSAQMKIIVDRMFSLYKWDNAAGTMNTPLKGKTLVLLASAFDTNSRSKLAYTGSDSNRERGSQEETSRTGPPPAGRRTGRTPTKLTDAANEAICLKTNWYEDVGLDALEKPFSLTAGYSGMKFESLLVPDAGVSGEIRQKEGVRKQAFALGAKLAFG